MATKTVQRSVVMLALTAFIARALAQPAIDPFAAQGAKGGGAAGERPGVITSVEFVEAPINTVFKMISDLTGWSIIMSPEVSKSPPRINIWIKNMSAEEALQRI